mmetsp:Transcript_55895/g.125968  ORF Transcript_55895/g.125968 Transcript_55895/m.125968 type:complete len:273 (-) Transcript_55895:162-980(-)
MQSCFNVPIVCSSSTSCFCVISRSPSALALASFCKAMFFFAAAKSSFPNRSSSVKLCFSISKLCLELSSFFLAVSNSSLALSNRFSSVSMIELLRLVYAAASGAPRASLSSSSRCTLCTKAVNVVASWEPTIAALIITCNAWRRLPACCTCSIAAPPLRASRSRTAMARSSAPTTSTRSFSAVAKSASSVLRISAAAFKSASLVAIFPDVSSISAAKETEELEACSIAAFSSSTCAFAVLTSYFKFLDRSSHHALNSTYVWCAASPSLMTLA